MKKSVILSVGLLLIAVIIISCEDLLNVTFEGKKVKINFLIYPEQQIGEKVLSQGVFQNELDSLLQENNLSRENLKSAKLESIVIKAKNGGNFNPISWFKATFKAENLDELVVANIDEIVQDADSVNLNVIGDDLLQYLGYEEYSIKIVGANDEAITDTIEAQAIIKVTFTAGY